MSMGVPLKEEEEEEEEEEDKNKCNRLKKILLNYRFFLGACT